MSAANKTKEWLKTQLVNNGVPLPSSSAKKEEYQRLYEEQVLPRRQNTEFSSDDDAEEISTRETPTRSPSLSHNRSLNGSDSSTDKHALWAGRLSDANLYTALKANGRNVGGIVESTRALYQKVLVDMLRENEQGTLAEIENYLAQHKEAKDLWLQAGVELNGFNGVATNGNGNSENGYSDTDDDETAETASRASRSSRASSKRGTPIRSSIPSPLAAKESTPTKRTLVDSNSKARKGGSAREEVLNEEEDDDEEEEEEQEAVTASSSRPTYLDSPLYSRISSPATADSGSFNRPYSVRKTVVETVEKRTHRFYDDNSSEEVKQQPSSSSTVPPGNATAGRLPPALRQALGMLLVFIFLIALPLYAVHLYAASGDIDCTGGKECTDDELDLLLKSIEEDAKPDPRGEL